jgi:hypothetical protein
LKTVPDLGQVHQFLEHPERSHSDNFLGAQAPGGDVDRAFEITGPARPALAVAGLGAAFDKFPVLRLRACLLAHRRSLLHSGLSRRIPGSFFSITGCPGRVSGIIEVGCRKRGRNRCVSASTVKKKRCWARARQAFFKISAEYLDANRGDDGRLPVKSSPLALRFAAAFVAYLRGSLILGCKNLFDGRRKGLR